MKIGPWYIVFAFAAISLSAGAAVRSVPSQYSTIADAITAADADDIIEVAAGTYTVSAAIAVNKAVTIRGAGIGQTIVKRDTSVASMRLVELSDAGAIVENLTLDGGYLKSGSGAGAYVTAGTLRDCEVINCSGNHWSGLSGCGVYATGQSSLVLRCQIHDNYAQMGNGMGLAVANYAVARECLVYDNACQTDSANFAAYINQYGTLENCTVTRNDCRKSAAVGTATGNNNYKQVVTNCVVWGNSGYTPKTKSSSVIADGWTISGDLRRVTNTTTDDPDFLDFEGGDFRLDAASPCILPEQGCFSFDTTSTTCGVFTVTREVFPGETVVFTAGVFNCSGDYVWNFGDGSDPVVTSVPTTSHAYANIGSYDVSLTVGASSCLRRGYVKVCPRMLYVANGNATPVPPYATRATAAAFIEDAIEVAHEGAEIVVTSGTQQMRGTTPIMVFKGVTIRGETGAKEDVIVQKIKNADQAFNVNHPLARVESLTVNGNTAHGNGQNKYGGCIYIADAGGTISNCVLRGINYTSWDDCGGGVYMLAGLVTHCVISNNTVTSASRGGSGAYMTGGTIANSLLVRNNTSGASYDGGTVVMSGSSQLINCTIAGNTAGKYPGVVFKAATPKVYNCLFSDNISANYTGADAPAACVYNSATYASCFTACAAPLLINETCYTGNLGVKDVSANDFHIVLGSVCVDHATKTGIGNLPAVDLDGNPRLDDSGDLDIGCYELKVEGVQVSIAADVSTPTMNLAPFNVTYNATVAGADPNALTYLWDVYGDGSEIIETQVPTVTFTYTKYGSFKVKLTVVKDSEEYSAVNDVDAASYPPVLYVDVANANPVAPYDTAAKAANNLADAVNAAYAGARIIIASGRYPVANELFIDKPLKISGATGNPEDVVFYRNVTSTRIFSLNNADLTISSLTIERGYVGGNDARGAGVFFGLSGAMVTNCIIRNCTANGWNARGGAIAVDDSTSPALVTHCVITNNSCSPGGANYDYTGGIAACLKGGTIRNSLIAYNIQPESDSCANPCGVVVMTDDNARLENCTIAANSVHQCAGVKCSKGAIVNCVIAGNTPTVSTNPQDAVWSGEASKFDHCLAPLSINGNCFVQAQPYAAPAAGDFSLGAGSVGIDNATTLSWMAGAKDLAGNDRVRGEAPDIGAYEANPAAFAVSFVADKTEGFGPLTVTFTVTPVNDSGAGISCAWTVDGGEPEDVDGLTFVKTFAYGDHTVSLVATDNGSRLDFTVPGFVKIYSAPKTMFVAPADGSVTSAYPYATMETAATNVKHAVEAALANTEIVLMRGLHISPFGEIVYLNRPVDIRGETGNPADVILRERNYQNRIFQLNNKDARVRNMTLEATRTGSGNATYAHCAYFDVNGGVVSNCVLRNAYSPIWGNGTAAARLCSDDAVLSHCIISNCTIGCSNGAEKGIAVTMEKGRMEECLVVGNRVSKGDITDANLANAGGAIYVTGGTVMNCTIVSNAHPNCAGIYSTGGTVVNTIISGNDSDLVDQLGQIKGTATYSHCLTSVGTEIENVIAVEPFADTFSDNPKHLWWPSRTSKAFDGGDKTVVTSATDLGGRPRRLGRSVDIGAYEDGLIGTSIILR